MEKRWSPFNIVSVTFGFAFLYLPIVLLIIYSFNASRLVTVWAGFSTVWYSALWQDQSLLDAAWVTIRVGLLSASIATVLGTLAATTLVRFFDFRGRLLFTGMVYAPLVMPDVITGLSLLLLFVAMDLDRGFWTVTIAHVNFSMCFVAVVVQSRLVTFDRSLEEAAQDLGCPPWKTFFLITLPVIWPAVAAGWMLAFTLSLGRPRRGELHLGAGRHDAADEDLQPSPARRDAEDQRRLHHPHRHRLAGRHRGRHRPEAERGQAPARRASRRLGGLARKSPGCLAIV